MKPIFNAEEIIKYVDDNSFDPDISTAFKKWYIDTCQVIHEHFVGKEISVMLAEIDVVEEKDQAFKSVNKMLCTFLECDGQGKAIKALTSCGLNRKGNFITGLATVELITRN